jgi:hypothetical protein
VSARNSAYATPANSVHDRIRVVQGLCLFINSLQRCATGLKILCPATIVWIQIHPRYHLFNNLQPPAFYCNPKFDMAKEPFVPSHVQMVRVAIPGAWCRKAERSIRHEPIAGFGRASVTGTDTFICSTWSEAALRTPGCPFLLSFEKSGETRLKGVAE